MNESKKTNMNEERQRLQRAAGILDEFDSDAKLDSKTQSAIDHLYACISTISDLVDDYDELSINSFEDVVRIKNLVIKDLKSVISDLEKLK